MFGTQKIPFTCAYAPGRSKVHVVVPVVLVVILPATLWAAGFERDALQDPVIYAAMLGVLALTWAGVRWRNALEGSAMGARPEFEDEPGERFTNLDVWDVRFQGGKPDAE